MKNALDMIAPTQKIHRLPYWRIALRGCSQLCFQSNELTGLFFLAAVLVASPISAAYLLAAAFLAPAGRMLLGEKVSVLETGMPGLNPCLLAISLPAFFHTGWTNVGMWIVLLASVACAVALVRLCIAVLPFPTLVLPFLLIFWTLDAAAPRFEILQPIVFKTLTPEPFHPLRAVMCSLGQTLFAPSIWSGLLFIAGLTLSNWRHGLIAVFGAMIGTVVSYYYHVADPAGANLGLFGFNGVLTGVAVFVLCGGKLRLAILGALLATILTPAVAEFGVVTLSAPYAFTTWLMLALGWIEDHWFGIPPKPATRPDATSRSA